MHRCMLTKVTTRGFSNSIAESCSSEKKSNIHSSVIVYSLVKLGPTRSDRLVTVRSDMVRLSSFQSGPVRSGPVLVGLIWSVFTRTVVIRFGPVRRYESEIGPKTDRDQL